MTTDGDLWKSIRDHVRDAHWQRVETGEMGRGVPDLNGCMNGVEIWAELKFTRIWSVNVRPEQVAWIERRVRAGGRVFLIVRRRHSGGPVKGSPEDEMLIYSGDCTRVVAALGILRGPPPLLRESGGPSCWDWGRVRDVLFTAT